MTRRTITDVARAAGVSTATVDRVLNRRRPVRQETVQRVLAAAEAIGFHALGLIRQRLAEDVVECRLGFILQQRTTPFYRALGDALGEAARASQAIRGKPASHFLEDLTPQAVVDKLHQLGSRVDVLAVVAADHPKVCQAIDQLRAKGVPTFALLSDLSTQARAGYVGLDNRKVGRTAAWAVARFCKVPGKIAIVIGSHRYLCQELCEISFRSYFREHAAEFQLLEPLVSLEDPRLAYEAVLALLKRHPDLAGIYVAGGGIEGVIEALREHAGSRRIVTVCHELTEITRAALVDGIVDLVISNPMAVLAEKTVEAMICAFKGKSDILARQIVIPFDISVAESL